MLSTCHPSKQNTARSNATGWLSIQQKDLRVLSPSRFFLGEYESIRYLEPRYQQNEKYPVDCEAWGPEGYYIYIYQVPRSGWSLCNYRNTNGPAKQIHPGRLTWNTIMEVWKIMFLSKWVICRFHVNLPGCTSQRNTKSDDVQKSSLCDWGVPTAWQR